MINTYAIEPEAVVEWAKNPLAGRYIIDNFGIGTPALMAEFPKLKNWRKQFRNLSSSLGEMEKKRLEELFQHLIQKTIHRYGYEYDGTLPWLENAKKEDTRLAFKAIIANTSDTIIHEQVLPVSSTGAWPVDKWHPDRGASIEKKADKMAKSVAPMLHNSQKVIFIDPYFIPKKYIRTMEAFFKECWHNEGAQGGKDIEIHTSADIERAVSDNHFKEECERQISSALPPGVAITFKRWSRRSNGEKLHNRYILTDIGGVSFPGGLNEGGPGETDELHLLTSEQHRLLWERYSGEKPAFDLQYQFMIIGG